MGRVVSGKTAIAEGVLHGTCDGIWGKLQISTAVKQRQHNELPLRVPEDSRKAQRFGGRSVLYSPGRRISSAAQPCAKLDSSYETPYSIGVRCSEVVRRWRYTGIQSSISRELMKVLLLAAGQLLFTAGSTHIGDRSARWR